MTTPVLTKPQQKKTLATKKGSIKGLKNVLAQPYENYWPLLKNDNGATLENLLRSLLPALKRSEIKVIWSELRKMKKTERSAARRAAKVSHSIDDEAIAKSIVYGINAVTRLIEKDDVSCILLDSTVEPSLLIKHIVVMARNKNIPVILISFLKKVTLEYIGFASAAFGLKKHVKDSAENYFYKLYEKILEISSEFLKSKVPIALFQEKMQVNEQNISQENLQSIESDKEEVKPCTVSTDHYLYRTSKKERVFVPGSVSKDKPKIISGWSDYIALSNDNLIMDQKKVPLRFFESVKSISSNSNNSNSDKIQCKTTEIPKDECNDKISYKSLKVKRLQGNELRPKAIRPPKVKKK